MNVKDLAWLVQVEKSFDTHYIAAHIVRPQEDGELWLPDSHRYDKGPEYTDFVVRCYLGEPAYMAQTLTETGSVRLWGNTHGFRQVHFIESAEHAKRISATMAKVERGLDKAREESGYVTDGDYLAYLTRVAGALGIRTYYVRQQRRQLNISGDKFRKVNAETLQWWIRDVAETAAARPAELVY